MNNSAVQQRRRRGIGAGERCGMQTQEREARGDEGGRRRVGEERRRPGLFLSSSQFLVHIFVTL
jgi:hypothetical protein